MPLQRSWKLLLEFIEGALLWMVELVGAGPNYFGSADCLPSHSM